MKNYRYNNPNMLKMNLMIIRQVRQQLEDKGKWEGSLDWASPEYSEDTVPMNVRHFLDGQKHH